MKKFVKHLSYLFCTILILSGFVQNISYAQTADTETVNVMSSNSETLVFTVSVPWKLLVDEVQEVNGNQWTSLEFLGWQKIAQPGAPELPFLTKSIGVPFGAALDVNVTPGRQHHIQLSAPVIPALNKRLIGDLPGLFTGDYVEPQFIYERIPDLSIYERGSVFPGKLAGISNDGIMRQQRIAGVSIYPIQLNIQTNVLTIYESVTVTVSFSNTIQIENSYFSVEQPVYEALYQDTLLNYDAARLWRREMNTNLELIPNQLMVDNASIETIPWTPPVDAYRIVIDEEGMYKVSYGQLNSIGASILLEDPLYYQMFSQGDEIAIEVTGSEDHSFDDGDLIIFYGEKKETKYSDQNVYWLSSGSTPGLRIGARDASPIGDEIAPHYRAMEHFEQNSNQYAYYTTLPGDDDFERITWTIIYSLKDNWTYNFSLLAPVSTEPGRITFSLFGLTDLQQDPDHHLKAQLNGVDLGDITWNGKIQVDWSVDVPAGLLNANSNQLVLSLVKDLGTIDDLILLDWIELEYPNSFLTNNNLLDFTYETTGTKRFKIDGFSESAINVYDVTNPYEVVKLNGISITPVDDSYFIDFEESITSTMHYIALSDPALRDVSSIIQDFPSDLQNVENSAEYIIITHSAFRSQADTLAAYRNGQGLSTIVVDIQDIYDEFAYGVVGVQPIRGFLGYALTEWQAPAPAYVLLVGDGHFDPKDYFGFGRTSFIPPYLAMADPWMGETAVDNRYVTLIGSDTMPDMMIGRLAVNTLEEANAMVNKIISYEANLNAGEWQTHFLAIADKADTAGNFPLISDELVQTQLPSSFQVDKVYYGIAPHVTNVETKAGIINQINAGAMFVNYIGHGYYGGWANGNIFAASDVPALNNITMLPIVLSMTCSDGFFHYPYPYSSNREGLAETFTRSSLGGAVASWSPTGEGLVTGHDRINRGFLQAYFTDGANTIGEAILAGKLKLWNVGHELELLDLFTLFGDPALNFNRSTLAIDDSYAIEENTTLITSSENGVLANDLNPGLLSLTAELVTGTANGVLNLNADGSFTYSPVAEWSGLDEFTYIIFDGAQHSNVATVSIQVNPINYPPIAFDQVIFTLLNQPVEITLTMMDDSVYSGPSRSGFVSDSAATDQLRAITFEIVDQPASGLLDGTAPNMIYTPNDGFLGQDSFTFKVNDGQYDSNVATVIINVTSEIYKIYLPLIVK